MREVSGRIPTWLVEVATQQGVTPERIAEGLPQGFDLRLPFRRMDWDDFALLCDRMEQLVGRSTLDEWGALHTRSRHFRFIGLVVSLARTPAELFALGQRWVGRSVFLNLRNEVDQLPDGRVRVTLEIPEPYGASEAFFWMYRGALRWAPHFLGGGEVPVDCEISPRRAVYLITLPDALPRSGRLRA